MSFNYDRSKKIQRTRVPIDRQNVDKIPIQSPPTESQLELIATLKQKLDGIGKDISYLAEPETRFVAKHVINSLIKLCKKYNL